MAGTITPTTVAAKPRGIVKVKVAITCDASGDATVTTVGAAYGRLVGVGYKPGTFDTGVNLTVTDADTAATVFALSSAGTSARYIRPTANITLNTGVAVTAATTAVDVNRDLYVAGKLKVVAAAGGSGGAGELHLVFAEA